MNYYKEYENLEIPLYKMPKRKKNTSVCQWSSTRPTKVTAKPKKNLVVETAHKIASEQLEILPNSEQNKTQISTTNNSTDLKI